MTKSQESMYHLICNVLQLKLLIKENTLEDELCGDCVVISSDKLGSLVERIKKNLTGVCQVELGRSGEKNSYALNERPLVEAILIMNNNNHGKGELDEFRTTDDLREVVMGETSEQNPFRKTKEDTDGTRDG